MATLLVAFSCGGEEHAEGPGVDESRGVASEEPQAGAELADPSLGDGGNEDAPVILIEYADFQ